MDYQPLMDDFDDAPEMDPDMEDVYLEEEEAEEEYYPEGMYFPILY